MPTMKRAAIDELGDLHLGRRDEVRVSGAARGEARARHAPARVTQHAAEGRLAADVARQPDRRRIEAGLDGHRLAFGGVQHRLERHSLVEHLAAALVDAAHGRADLLVRVASEVLGHEVDEAALLLEEAEEAERLGTRRLGGRRRRRGRLPSGRRGRPRGQERDHQRQRERRTHAPGEHVARDEEVTRGDRGGEHEREEETPQEHARLAITRRGRSKRARAACIASGRGKERFMPPLERYARFLTAHAWTVLVAVGVATAVLAAGMGRLRVSIDFEASLPANHPFVQIDHQIRREFGGRNTMIVAVVPRDGEVWRPDVLRVVQEVTLAALRLPDVIAPNVVSLAAPSVRHAEEEGGTIRVDYLMRDVPETPEEIAALRARLEDDPALRGVLVTPDQRAALVMLDFYDGTSGQDVFARTLSLAEPYRDRPLDFYFAGEPMFVMASLEQSREVAWRIPLTFLVIAGMLLVSFRSVQGMLVPMLTATLSTVWGLGLMGWTGIVIDTWNVAVPILLIAVAAAHSAQMLKRYGEEVERTRDNRAAVIASTVSMGPVMVAAGATAALGFASLALFGVRSIGNFGLSCAYGIASAVLL